MKSAWALGAAFVAVVLVLFVFSVLAKEMGSAERLSSTEKFEGIDVPTIGTVGDFPDPAHRVVVNVTAEGTIVVDGTTYAFDDVRGEVKRRAARSRGNTLADGKGTRLSGESIVLRVDGDVGWGATCALLDACAKAEVNRVFFGVRHDGDGAEGAVAVFSPTDVGGEQFGDPSFDQRNVSVSWNAGAGTPAAVRDSLAALPESRTSKLIVALEVSRALTTREALTMLDAVLRSGAASVEIAVGHASRFDSTTVRVTSAPGGPASGREIVIEDESWTDATNAARHEHHGRHVLSPAAPPPPMPSVPRVRGALTGVTSPRSLVYCD